MSYTISNKDLLKRIMKFPIYNKLTLLIHIFAPSICLMLIILKFYYKQEKRIGNINVIILTIFSFLMIRTQYTCIKMKEMEMFCQFPVLIMYLIFYINYVYYINTIFKKKRKWELYDKYDKIVIGYFVIASLWLFQLFTRMITPIKKRR
jgi:hypothetical protein